MNKNHPKVAVLMSGGVDSSVAALILSRSGFDVSGLYLDFLDDHRGHIAAEKVAKSLSIEFNSVDISKNFRDTVVSYFIDAYQGGKTPNPCVVCNREIKFGLAWKLAELSGAQKLATGHYCRLEKRRGAWQLRRAADRSKDQSYFLYRLRQSELARLIFPLGCLTKDQVRQMADAAGLPYETAESQDVCFLDNREKMDVFLKKNIRSRNGEIINQSGQLSGSHEGLPFYTLGQRKGIKIGGTGPYYVCGRDFKSQTLKITNDKNDPALWAKSFRVSAPNWLIPEPPVRADVAIRYGQPPVKCLIRSMPGSRSISVEASQPLWAVSPGQSAVFYRGGRLLGGESLLEEEMQIDLLNPYDN